MSVKDNLSETPATGSGQDSPMSAEEMPLRMGFKEVQQKLTRRAHFVSRRAPPAAFQGAKEQ
jgi:hypothetical protein